MTYREGIIKETEFFTTSELAQKLKMNVQVITRKVQAGEIEAYKIGKDWRIPEQSVYTWLEHLSNKPVIEPPGSARTKSTKTESSRVKPKTNGRSKRKFLLEYILAQFEPNKTYTEDQVNKIIARYHNDFVDIRQEFIQEQMMQTAEGQYCRRTGYQFSD
ncbi:MAG: DUF2087 domain-containing protein [bacterium]